MRSIFITLVLVTGFIYVIEGSNVSISKDDESCQHDDDCPLESDPYWGNEYCCGVVYKYCCDEYPHDECSSDDDCPHAGESSEKTHCCEDNECCTESFHDQEEWIEEHYGLYIFINVLFSFLIIVAIAGCCCFCPCCPIAERRRAGRVQQRARVTNPNSTPRSATSGPGSSDYRRRPPIEPRNDFPYQPGQNPFHQGPTGSIPMPDMPPAYEDVALEPLPEKSPAYTNPGFSSPDTMPNHQLDGAAIDNPNGQEAVPSSTSGGFVLPRPEYETQPAFNTNVD